MSLGEEAQNTWDKLRGKDSEGEALNEQLDDQSNADTQEAMAADATETDVPALGQDAGFREHLGQEDMPLAGDMAGDDAIEDLPAEDPADADLDSDRDYDTDQEESSADGFTDRDSF